MKKFVCLALLFGTIAICFAQAQAPQSLDSAMQGCARYLQGRFPKGTRAAIVAVQSENREIGEFAHKKFSEVLVNGGWFTVVERDAAALASIDREMDRHLNFEVSEETELSIGKRLGAEIIISGSLARSGQNWRLDIQALRVESAERAAQWSAEQIRPDPAWASLARPRSASLSFAGDTLAAREKQTIAAGLRNAMQAWKTSLELDENAAAAEGYNFSVTVEITKMPSDLLRSEVAVAFTQGGRVLCQTGTYMITETAEALIARRIGERLRNDKDFFARVNEAIK